MGIGRAAIPTLAQPGLFAIHGGRDSMDRDDDKPEDQKKRKRRRRGGAASGLMAQPRLDQRPRKTKGLGGMSMAGLGSPPSAPGATASAAIPGGIKPDAKPAADLKPGDDDDAGLGLKAGGKAFKPGGKKGKLHDELGLPRDQKIPAARLSAAARSDNPEIRRDAIRAQTMKKWHHGG